VNRRYSQVLALPADVKMSDVLWEPDAAELQALRRWKHFAHHLKRLQAKKRQWESQDRKHDAYMDRMRRKFAEGLQERVAADARANELQAAADAATEKIRSYYLGELNKEIAAADQKRLEALAAITKRIEKDNRRVEREELVRRGVVRGLRAVYRGG
jgi:hypothetical protein